MLISHEVIQQHVREAVSLALGLDTDELNMGVSLVNQYGAESLDFLDIAFRLERDFDIRLPRQSMLERAIDQYGADLFIVDGKLTAGGAEFIRRGLPEVKEKVSEGMGEDNLPSLLTADTWVRLVVTILEAMDNTCSECGATELQLVENTKIGCTSCGARIYPPHGDDVAKMQLPEMKAAVFGD